MAWRLVGGAAFTEPQHLGGRQQRMSWALVEWEGPGDTLGRPSGGLEPWTKVQPCVWRWESGDKQRSVLSAELRGQQTVSGSATPWTVACQAPLSMRFLRQEYWSGLPFPSPGDLPDPGIKSESPALQADSLPLSDRGSPADSVDGGEKGEVCVCRIPREPGDGGSVLAFLGLMALDWDLEGCLDMCRWRREVKGVPNIEIEAACDHGRERLVEESLLGKRLLKGKFGLPMVKGVECFSQELGIFPIEEGSPA